MMDGSLEGIRQCFFVRHERRFFDVDFLLISDNFDRFAQNVELHPNFDYKTNGEHEIQQHRQGQRKQPGNLQRNREPVFRVAVDGPGEDGRHEQGVDVAGLLVGNGEKQNRGRDCEGVNDEVRHPVGEEEFSESDVGRGHPVQGVVEEIALDEVEKIFDVRLLQMQYEGGGVQEQAVVDVHEGDADVDQGFQVS